MLGSSPAEASLPNRVGQTLIRGMTGAIEHLPEESTAYIVNHRVRDCRVFRCLRCEYSCADVLPLFAHEAAGASGARRSRAPSRGVTTPIWAEGFFQRLGRVAPRDANRCFDGVSREALLFVNFWLFEK